jgi:hypothetical protein
LLLPPTQIRQQSLKQHKQVPAKARPVEAKVVVAVAEEWLSQAAVVVVVVVEIPRRPLLPDPPAREKIEFTIGSPSSLQDF